MSLAQEARQIVVAEDAAAGREPVARFVAASVGPFGAMLADGSEYLGNYGRTVAQLRDFHRDRLAILAGTDADVLAAETIPEVEEAVAVASLLAEVPGAAAWVSFSCRDGGHLCSGAPVEEGVAAVDGVPGVVAVGVNCTAPEHLDELGRADPCRHRPADRRLPQQRRGLGRCRASLDGRRAGSRGRRRRPTLARPRRRPRRWLLPRDARSDRRPRACAGGFRMSLWAVAQPGREEAGAEVAAG